MRRTRVRLEQVASLDTLSRACWRAAKGKRQRPEVTAFLAEVDDQLARMGDEIRSGTYRMGPMQSFEIFDPKPRRIHAPCFRDRVLHHALFEVVGPVLDRSLVDDTYACREGKGSLAAVLRAQQHIRRYPWYVQLDVRSYFASIVHTILFKLLAGKLRGRGVLGLCKQIIENHEVTRGRGLPIGALSSQHFANFYLGRVDRFVRDELRVAGYVRYMDDLVAWVMTREEARRLGAAVRGFVCSELGLEMKSARVQRSGRGLSFLGYRVFAGALRLSQRRRRRYAAARERWEAAYREGATSSRGLQAGGEAALAITAHACSRGWRCEQLRRCPAVDA